MENKCSKCEKWFTRKRTSEKELCDFCCLKKRVKELERENNDLKSRNQFLNSQLGYNIVLD